MGIGYVGIMPKKYDAAASRKTAMQPGQVYGNKTPFGQPAPTGAGVGQPGLPSFPGFPAPNLGLPAGGAYGEATAGATGTGGGVGYNAPPITGSPTSSTMTNTGQASPDVRWQIDKYKERLGADPTQRAIDIATSQTRDAASGMAKEYESTLARRGISGSGAGAKDIYNKFTAPAQRQAAAQSAGIALGRERDIDQMVQGGTSLMRAPQELGLAERGLGLQQTDLQQRADIARANLAMSAQNNAMQQQQQAVGLYQSYLNLFR